MFLIAEDVDCAEISLSEALETLMNDEMAVESATLEKQIALAKTHRLFALFEDSELAKLKSELGDEYVPWGDPDGDQQADLDFFDLFVAQRHEELRIEVERAKLHPKFPLFESTVMADMKAEQGDKCLEFGDPKADPQKDLEAFEIFVNCCESEEAEEANEVPKTNEKDNEEEEDGADNDDKDKVNGEPETQLGSEIATETPGEVHYTPSHDYPAPPSDKHPDINRILESSAEARAARVWFVVWILVCSSLI